MVEILVETSNVSGRLIFWEKIVEMIEEKDLFFYITCECVCFMKGNIL